jgi:hypothetical protein
MIAAKKHTLSKGKKSSLFIFINVLIFIALLVFVILKLFVFTEPIIPDNHSIISIPPEFHDISDILSQPYEEVTSVSTKYSMLYKDGINRKMYVFAVPVREIENDQYFLFGNRIYENGDGVYRTQNKEFNIAFKKESINLNYTDLAFAVLIDSESIAKEEDYQNTYGEIREAVKYSGAVDGIDMRCIPTYNGLLMEFELANKPEKKELTFEIDINKLEYINDPAGYVQIMADENQAGMIYQGIVVDEKNKYYPNNAVKIDIKNKRYYLTVDLIDLPPDISYPAKLAVSFDFYCFKMFYDTSVYEAVPKTNTILNKVSIFDSINEKQNGYTYLKYNIKSFTPKISSLVGSFTFNFYVMSVTDSVDIEVHRVPKDWCSWTITWKNKPKFKEKLGEFTISEPGWHKIDLTEYAKMLIERNYDKQDTNSVVLKIKDGSRGYAVLASADNTYAPPYFEVNYRVQEHEIK